MVTGGEIPCRLKSGEIRTCRFFSNLVMMDGQPYVLTTVDDVTDRMRAKKPSSRATGGLPRLPNPPGNGSGRWMRTAVIPTAARS